MNEDEKIYLRHVVTDRTGENIISETRYELTGTEPGNDDLYNVFIGEKEKICTDKLMIPEPKDLIKDMLDNPEKYISLYNSRYFIHYNGSVVEMTDRILKDPVRYMRAFNEMKEWGNSDISDMILSNYFSGSCSNSNYMQIKRKKHRRKYRTRNGKRKNKH